MTEYLAPITMPTAGERIAERIVTAIALGEFVPDQRLPTERELAAMLEVSRTTVREALQRLRPPAASVSSFASLPRATE